MELLAQAANDAVSLAPVGKGLVYGLATLGPGLAIGLVFSAAIQAIARQPESAGLVRPIMFLGFALAEALALLGFVLFFLIT
ncbi:MAG TPA: ATP synthase F0 subunit C [Actinomycetota bacterium]|nr:ATP synthase F0 subunit C [Actinomycetota bacterium]